MSTPQPINRSTNFKIHHLKSEFLTASNVSFACYTCNSDNFFTVLLQYQSHNILFTVECYLALDTSKSNDGWQSAVGLRLLQRRPLPHHFLRQVGGLRAHRARRENHQPGGVWGLLLHLVVTAGFKRRKGAEADLLWWRRNFPLFLFPVLSRQSRGGSQNLPVGAWAFSRP